MLIFTISTGATVVLVGIARLHQSHTRFLSSSANSVRTIAVDGILKTSLVGLPIKVFHTLRGLGIPGTVVRVRLLYQTTTAHARTLTAALSNNCSKVVHFITAMEKSGHPKSTLSFNEKDSEEISLLLNRL